MNTIRRSYLFSSSLNYNSYASSSILVRQEFREYGTRYGFSSWSRPRPFAENFDTHVRVYNPLVKTHAHVAVKNEIYGIF